ncbi:LOW QUALITY PROTEIN: hypothetical protein U9M48_015544 [Paspalum notatum var. saurae]|uniref:Uncharacterized protein n=1 Tax=Paspalum notatum var. saurae TaxID=547442 RepID=A0AAQ3T456_PASNO
MIIAWALLTGDIDEHWKPHINSTEVQRHLLMHQIEVHHLGDSTLPVEEPWSNHVPGHCVPSAIQVAFAPCLASALYASERSGILVKSASKRTLNSSYSLDMCL